MNDNINIPKIYEDSDILVIDKPVGLVVNKAQTVKTLTLQDYLLLKYELVFKVDITEENKEFINRTGIVHRIDKETSGILIAAKNVKSFENLQKQFFNHEITKTYLTIVHGTVEPASGQINAPVGRLPWNRERFGITPEGKDSLTEYRKIKEIKYNNEILSVLEVYPKTGRTHQIRVHMKYINHPILGDYLYAGRKTSRNDRLTAKRVMLHARKIVFKHPATDKLLSLESQIPHDMIEIIGL